MKKVILVLLAVMMFGCVVVSADIPSDYPPLPDFLQTTSNHYVITTWQTSSHRIYMATSGAELYINGSNMLDTTTDLRQYSYSSTTGNWHYTVVGSASCSSHIFHYSNYDICRLDGSVFFSGQEVVIQPTPTPQPTQTTLMVVEAESLGNLMTGFGHNLGVLLPVGVILLSIILVMCLIPRLRRLFL